MPVVKPQHMKSIHTIGLQPRKFSSRILSIMLLDLAGRTGNQIAEELGMTPSRISIIRNTPMYKDMLARRRVEFENQFIDKKTTAMVEDPVTKFISERCLTAAKVIDEQMVNPENRPMVRMYAAQDILNRGGHKGVERKLTRSIEISEKMCKNIEKALQYEKPEHGIFNGDAGRAKVTIKEEISS